MRAAAPIPTLPAIWAEAVRHSAWITDRLADHNKNPIEGRHMMPWGQKIFIHNENGAATYLFVSVNDDGSIRATNVLIEGEMKGDAVNNNQNTPRAKNSAVNTSPLAKTETSRQEYTFTHLKSNSSSPLSPSISLPSTPTRSRSQSDANSMTFEEFASGKTHLSLSMSVNDFNPKILTLIDSS
ncbi:hypothetical protein FISHEDRAFT_71466 [Fistulina hepatica ATCC 64428]|uniref:Uncharacterized protein n=1 Tax=Fistulina hepatica ATCC 64428 TaxID=1128425 RepID=A0A0D7AHC3_9AGAR|nr:hypothetical protein FISHEDRAFT_71466 [Fistulina hepatica ATCC 64428]